MKAMLEEAFSCGTRPPELLKLAEQMRNMAQQANGQFPPTETECDTSGHEHTIATPLRRRQLQAIPPPRPTTRTRAGAAVQPLAAGYRFQV